MWHKQTLRNLDPFTVEPALPQPGASHPWLECTPAMGRIYILMIILSYHLPLTAAPWRLNKRRLNWIASYQPPHCLEWCRVRFLRIDPILGGLWVLAYPPGLHLSFFFPLSPPSGSPSVLQLLHQPIAPAARWAEQKIRLGDDSHLYFSKANRTDALSNGALQLKAGEMHPEGGSFPTKSWQSHLAMARNIMKQNIKLWWTAKPGRLKPQVNRDVLICINARHANSGSALGLIWMVFFTASLKRMGYKGKKRCCGFLRNSG